MAIFISPEDGLFELLQKSISQMLIKTIESVRMLARLLCWICCTPIKYAFNFHAHNPSHSVLETKKFISYITKAPLYARTLDWVAYWEILK